MDENESLYCIKCGKQLRAGAKFCNSCGTKVPVLEQPAEQPQPAPDITPQPGFVQPPPYAPAAGQAMQTENKPDKKGGKGAVFSLLLALIAAAALGVLIGICPEIYHKEDVFEYAAIGIAAVSGLALLCFILGRKSKAGIMGCVLSVLTAAALAGYNFYYIPKCKDDAHDDYMHKVKNVGVLSEYGATYEGKCYPYSSAKFFYSREKKYFTRLEDYLKGLYDKAEYSKWVSACMYVNSTLDRGALENSYIERVCSQLAKIDANDLRSYHVLFDANTPFGKVQTEGSYASSTAAGRMKSDIQGRMKQADDQANGKSTVIMSYGGAFYCGYGLAVYQGSYGYVVVDLTNGNYFYTGDWI